MKNYFIIGASAAGLTAALELRKLDPLANITCITQEADLPYNKCFLVDYLAKEIPQEKLYLRNKEYLKLNKINILYNTQVTSIIADYQELLVKNLKINLNNNLKYNKLLIATGSSPFKLNIKDINKYNNIFNFHTLEDTLNLNNYIIENKPKKAIIVGAGLTGLEVADSLWRRGLSVDIVDINKNILNNILDPKTASLLEDTILAKNNNLINKSIKFYLGYKLLELNNNLNINSLNKANTAILENLKNNKNINLNTDLIILAIGVKANLININNSNQASTLDNNTFSNIDNLENLSKSIKPEFSLINNQIKVDSYLKTNINNIWAAGDVICALDQLSGKYIASRSWPDAIQQGRIAARNIFGRQEKYSGLAPFIRSHFFGLDFVSGGSNLPEINISEKTVKKVSKFYQISGTTKILAKKFNFSNSSSFLRETRDQEGALSSFDIWGEVGLSGKLRRELLS